MDCVKDDMKIKAVSIEMKSDREEKKKERYIVPFPLSAIRIEK
jgi:hypothetical protein